MRCESCAISCPAILAATVQSAELGGELANLAEREAGRQANREQWDRQMTDALAAGEPIDDMRRASDLGEMFAFLARGADTDREVYFNGEKAMVEYRAAQRQEACTQGPRDGFLGSGIGNISCRSAIQDDGLPNKGPRLTV